MPQMPTRDKAQEIIDIAKRIYESGLWLDKFDIVFEAIVRVEFPDEHSTVIEINQDISQETAKAIMNEMGKEVARLGSRVPKRYD